MKGLIYIELTESLTSAYEKELILWAKARFEGITTFDLDSRSDSFMFNYAADLVEQSDKIVLYISIDGAASAAQVTRLAEKLITHKTKRLVLMQGDNALLNRLFSLLKESYYKGLTPEEEKKRIEEFFEDKGKLLS